MIESQCCHFLGSLAERNDMDNSVDRALVRTILEHAQDYPWTLQDIGVLGLRLDDRRKHRLQVWDPTYCVGDPPIHDHPFDFTSTVVVGEMTNTVYERDPVGVEYRRLLYRPSQGHDHQEVDRVTLTGRATAIIEGCTYSQTANELHTSHQLPGTVNIITYSFQDITDLTVCLPDGAMFISGGSRPATSEEIKEITAKALERF